jgi:hypothetical protein
MLDEKRALHLQEAFVSVGFVPAKKGPFSALRSVEYYASLISLTTT